MVSQAPKKLPRLSHPVKLGASSGWMPVQPQDALANSPRSLGTCRSALCLVAPWANISTAPRAEITHNWNGLGIPLGMDMAFNYICYQIILNASDNFKTISDFSAATTESPSNCPQDARLGWGCTERVVGCTRRFRGREDTRCYLGMYDIRVC